MSAPTHLVAPAALLTLTAALLPGLPGLPGLPATATTPGDAGRISFVSVVDGQEEIVTALPDGSDATVVSDWSGRDTDPAWSPDGSRIAYASGRADEGHLDIWVMDADGTDQVNLTPGPDTTGEANAGVEPTWSPDGTAIAYTYQGDVWTVPSAGGVEVNLMPGAGADQAGANPSWSPDGTRIAFVRSGDIWVMDADGGDPTRLTTTAAPAAEKYPDWSPDGTRLVYERQGQIWRMDADGSGQVMVSGGADLGGTRPEWSPEGDRIVFSSSGYDAPNEPDIFTARPDGQQVVRLVTGTTYSDQAPAWQPVDGGMPWGTWTTSASVVTKRAVEVDGEVFPANPGAEVRVTLLYKTPPGYFRQVGTTVVTLSEYGDYAASFDKPVARKCRVKATFLGDPDSAPSRERFIFPCGTRR